MMIVKLKDKTFNLFDTLGDMGIWNMDLEGLSKYLNMIKEVRKIAGNDVRNYLIQEPIESSVLTKVDDGDPFLKKILNERLPLKCHFNTDILLSKAKEFEKGIINPPGISLDVNNLCNFACKWCCVDVNSRIASAGMIVEHIQEKIIKPAVMSGNLAWFLVGGEPGLTPEKTAKIAESITQYTAQYSEDKPLIALDTNGTNFVENAQLFKKSGINSVQFSLSSASDKVDRYFRGVPSTVNSVELVRSAINTAKSLDIHCGINMIVWRENKIRHNFEEIEGIIDFAFDLKVDFVRITPAVNTGASIKNGTHVDIADVKYIAHKIYNKAQLMKQYTNTKTKIISSIPAFLGEDDLIDDSPLICRAGTCFIHIDHLGNMYPCVMFMPRFCIGNVNQSDIMDLWRNSKALEKWRTVVDICQECGSCSDRVYCIGRCRAYAWTKFHTIDLKQVPAQCPKKRG